MKSIDRALDEASSRASAAHARRSAAKRGPRITIDLSDEVYWAWQALAAKLKAKPTGLLRKLLEDRLELDTGSAPQDPVAVSRNPLSSFAIDDCLK